MRNVARRRMNSPESFLSDVETDSDMIVADEVDNVVNLVEVVRHVASLLSASRQHQATCVFPAQARHGFTNVGDGPLHIIGAVPYPIHETMIADDPKGTFTVGWEPDEDYRRRRLIEEGPPK